MTPDLSTCRKVAGIKQTMRALREHHAEKLYIACDADPAVLAPIEALARKLYIILNFDTFNSYIIKRAAYHINCICSCLD